MMHDGMRGYGGPVGALNLTDEQQDKLFALQEANRKKNWDTMSSMRSEMFKAAPVQRRCGIGCS